MWGWPLQHCLRSMQHNVAKAILVIKSTIPVGYVISMKENW